ncbi:MAG: cadherin-like beta sandwich domain-containing protein [Clostridia bacterium]|nr:cadherin-like beta sandwich domain-containing protein [Clostridia bacterium]
MKNRMRLRAAAAIMLCLCMLLSLMASAAVMPFETQFDYDKADIAWLTDLKVKEDVSVSSAISDSFTALAGGVNLTAHPEYPYTETAESFAKDVEKFCQLYDLNENSPRAAYIFLFEILSAASGAFDSQISDEAVVSYLENAGIVFPTDAETEDFVMARALFTAMMTGSLDTAVSDKITDGVQLQKVVISYLVSMSGMSEDQLLRFAPDGELNTLDEYVFAASALSLWMNGYNADVNMDPAEIYRLTAIMTVEKLGLSVSSDIGYEELNARYTAALLGKKYDVSVDPARLTEARAKGSAAFYILQLLGKKAGLTVREEGNSLESAFLLVADNSDAFSIEDGEFYADIYSYSCKLTALRTSLWICAETYLTGDNANVKVTANGTPLRRGLYTQVPISVAEPQQLISIRVEASDGGKQSVCTYELKVTQGTSAPAPSESRPAEQPSSDTVVSQILSQLGVSASADEILPASILNAAPQTVKNAVAFITPSFDGGTAAGFSDGDTVSSVATDAAVTLLKGINGIGLSQRYAGDKNIKLNFVTFE